MIDVVMCIRRKPDVDADEFRRCRLTEHGERVKRAAATIGAVRYVQYDTIDTGLEAIVQEPRGGPTDRFDGIAVISFDSLDDMLTWTPSWLSVQVVSVCRSAVGDAPGGEVLAVAGQHERQTRGSASRSRTVAQVCRLPAVASGSGRMER